MRQQQQTRRRGGGKNIFVRVCVKAASAEGRRRLHTNTAYARLSGFNRPSKVERREFRFWGFRRFRFFGFRVQGLSFRVQGSGFRCVVWDENGFG